MSEFIALSDGIEKRIEEVFSGKPSERYVAIFNFFSDYKIREEEEISFCCDNCGHRITNDGGFFVERRYTEDPDHCGFRCNDCWDHEITWYDEAICMNTVKKYKNTMMHLAGKYWFKGRIEREMFELFQTGIVD